VFVFLVHVVLGIRKTATEWGGGKHIEVEEDPMKSGVVGSKTAILPEISFCPSRCAARTKRETHCALGACKELNPVYRRLMCD
jgi:hypothetical protein